MQAKKVLVPVHGNECDAKALQFACDMARKEKGKVYVLYVIEVERAYPLDSNVSSGNQMAERVLKQMENLGKEYKGHVEAEIIQARDEGPAVVFEAMERNVDAIVVGIPFQRRYGSFSLGRTVPHILKNAPCPVVLWRQAMEVTSNGRNG